MRCLSEFSPKFHGADLYLGSFKSSDEEVILPEPTKPSSSHVQFDLHQSTDEAREQPRRRIGRSVSHHCRYTLALYIDHLNIDHI